MFQPYSFIAGGDHLLVVRNIARVRLERRPPVVRQLFRTRCFGGTSTLREQAATGLEHFAVADLDQPVVTEGAQDAALARGLRRVLRLSGDAAGRLIVDAIDVAPDLRFLVTAT